MYDKELALDSLYNIQDALLLITERAAVANTADDFLMSPDGMLRLDAICMNLIALGEAVKDIPPMLPIIQRMIKEIIHPVQ